MFPSGPAAIALGSAPAGKPAVYSVMVPLEVISPIAGVPPSVNQSVPFGPAAISMAEAVLSALHRNDLVTAVQRDYLAGLLSPRTAAAVGLPVNPDAQAAYVLAKLLDPALTATVAPAIRDVTSTARVTAARKAEVAAELAMRPIRSQARC